MDERKRKRDMRGGRGNKRKTERESQTGRFRERVGEGGKRGREKVKERGRQTDR